MVDEDNYVGKSVPWLSAMAGLAEAPLASANFAHPRGYPSRGFGGHGLHGMRERARLAHIRGMEVEFCLPAFRFRTHPGQRTGGGSRSGRST